MARDVRKTEYNVQPLENPDGTLEGLSIQRTVRVSRVADDGRVLSYGSTEDVGEPLEILANKVADLVRELVDWPLYYARGEAAREAAHDRV